MDKLITIIFVLFGLWVLYALLIWTPVSMYAEAECLRNGYPKYSVTIGLERYCMTLDGAVTVKVDQIGGKP